LNEKNKKLPKKKYAWWDLIIILYHSLVIVLVSITYTSNLIISILGISLTAIMLIIFISVFRTVNPFLNWLSYGLTIPVYIYAIPLYSIYLMNYVIISTWDLIFPIFILIALVDSYFLFKRYRSTPGYSRVAITRAYRSAGHQISTQPDKVYQKWINDGFESDEKQKEAKQFLETYYKYNLILAIVVCGSIGYLILIILNYII